MDNLVGALALAVIVNIEEEKASKSRLRSVGTAPGVGESDCPGRLCRDDASAVRDEVDVDGRKRACAKLVGGVVACGS